MMKPSARIIIPAVAPVVRPGFRFKVSRIPTVGAPGLKVWPCIPRSIPRTPGRFSKNARSMGRIRREKRVGTPNLAAAAEMPCERRVYPHRGELDKGVDGVGAEFLRYLAGEDSAPVSHRRSCAAAIALLTAR